MTFAEWRKNRDLVDLYATHRMGIIGENERSVLLEAASSPSAPPAAGVNQDNAAFALGFHVGKRFMIDLMDAMAKLEPDQQNEPVETFEDPNNKKEGKKA